MNWLTIVGSLAILFFGIALGFFWYKQTLTEKAKKFKAKIARTREIEEEIIEQARKKATEIREQAEQRVMQLEEKRMEKLSHIEQRLASREEKLDEKLERLELEKEKLKAKNEEIQAAINEQTNKLSEIAQLSPEEAKEQLFTNIELTYKTDIQKFVEKYTMIKKEEADKEAGQIIARALPKMASEVTGEFTTILVDLPNEDFKGKLIGREWRNISYFEKITGVELIVDDTPLVVRLSCYDHEKRFVAKTALDRLVKDGRINPYYIEKIYKEVLSELDTILMDKGKEALTILNLTLMKPEIVRMVGQFFLRYSYGQNLWNHSIEVAKLSEAIAVEMGEDPILAKKAWLLHDIGKIQATTGQSHTSVGGEILRKFQMDSAIINAAESHHYDVPMTNIISWIVTTADGISASRPWARFNTRELFIEKMTELEKLVTTVEGIEKTHIMQAGREIMVYVDPGKTVDSDVEKILKTIADKIEEQLDYPGIIRVTGIRETKIVAYVK